MQLVPPVAPMLLVVEDDSLVRNVCVRLLRMRHYHVDAVEHGIQALDQLAKSRYDIVLTDLSMPQMNGLALTHEIRDRYPDVDTIMITAFGSIESAKQALKMGAFDYLTKPLEPDELERTIKTCLEVRELRALRAETEKLTEMVALMKLSRTITSTLDVATQVEEFVAQLWSRFRPTGISLSLLDPEDRALRLLAQRGLAGPILPGQETVIEREIVDDRLLYAHYQLVANHSSDNQAIQLLRVQDRSVGVLQLTWPADGPELSDNDRQLLEVFTSQVAVALENSRLYGTLKQQNAETIRALAAAIDARDPYTRGHSDQVTKYAVRMGEALEKPQIWIERLRYGALLHDIGKIGVPDSILLKPGALTEAEYDKMKEHPSTGRRIVESVRSLRDVWPMIEAHHERFNGMGYPYGLKGEQIPFEARVISVADAFDAMTSERAYRRGMPVDDALTILYQGRDQQWQGDLVELFIDLVQSEGVQLLEGKDRVPQSQVCDAALPWLVSRGLGVGN